MTVNRNNVNQKHAYLRKNKPAQLLHDDILKKIQTRQTNFFTTLLK